MEIDNVQIGFPESLICCWVQKNFEGYPCVLDIYIPSTVANPKRELVGAKIVFSESE